MHTCALFLFTENMKRGTDEMYVNDRAEMNYHEFLTSLRTMHGYPTSAVSTGVCCVSGLNRFENGNRVAEKLVCDRLTGRLGISCEKFEDYEQPKEYERWEHRLEILHAIRRSDLERAKQEVERYAKRRKLNRTNQQFVETMRYMILDMEGAPQEERYASVCKALKLTVPDYKRALCGGHLLADQELHLVLEMLHLQDAQIEEYEELITYMEGSCWGTLAKAKVYPKTALYICQKLLSEEQTEEKLRRGLYLCGRGIEYLRDSSRWYYVMEILECRRDVIHALLRYELSESERAELTVLLEENTLWEESFRRVFEQQGLPAYMTDFTYLYQENECYDMVDIIETRRKMLGFSRNKVGEDICSERTLVRCEREGMNVSVEVVRRLFERMGMCAEYRRARVISTDRTAVMLTACIAENINNRDFAEWEQNLIRLKDSLDMSLPQNRQQVARYEALLEFRSGRIDADEFYKWIKIALEYTFPISDWVPGKTMYFTRSELACIYDIAFKTNGDLKEKCLYVIEEMAKELLADHKDISVMLPRYELVLSVYASYLGNQEAYAKSNAIEGVLMKECIISRRPEVLPELLYNQIWNGRMVDQHPISDLQSCGAIAGFLKKSKREAFFQKKLLSDMS